MKDSNVNDDIDNGFIVIHRRMVRWEWFSDANVAHLFMYCILRANHITKKWRGTTIERGSFISSLGKIGIETGLSVQQVRTALDKLELTQEITRQATSRYSIITVKNYNKYQDFNTNSNKRVTNEQQTSNKRITTNNNDNNDNNTYINHVVVVEEEKQKKLNDFYGYYKNVYLSPANYGKLQALVLNSSVLADLIEELSEKIAQKDKRYLPYDEQFPDAHFINLMNFWKFRKNNPEKFMPKPSAESQRDEIAAANARGIEMYREYKRKQELKQMGTI